MPRAKNPIADLAAHRAKRADLDAKEEQLKSEAAQYLGSLMMKAGLHAWPDKALRDVIAALGTTGPEAAQSRLDLSQPKTRKGEGAKATLQPAE